MTSCKELNIAWVTDHRFCRMLQCIFKSSNHRDKHCCDQKFKNNNKNKQLFTNTFTTATSPSKWPVFFHRLPASCASHHKKSTQRTCLMPGNSTQYAVLNTKQQHTICHAQSQATACSMPFWPTQKEFTAYLLDARQQHTIYAALANTKSGQHKKSTQRTCSMPGWSMLYSGLRSTCSLIMGKQLRTCKARRSSGGPISSVGVLSFSEIPAREKESAVPGHPASW